MDKSMLTRQKEEITKLKELVLKGDDSPEKANGLAYCQGCIDACNVALKVLKADDEKTEAVKTEPVKVEDKPKPAKKAAKKKEEPKVVEEPVADDLDDLLG